ncbi:E3 ubiquitin-protein ligase PIB1, putative [Talaromyces stipitatus ATCC 10500]|uniref:RING-type E3 ubiquitin transferase n=1 Tax=Talaromyces stipitatus (strain ATCC 10500 / CBS 375.48 / QM 6759 / NRRL 1006) TaxID=441959 RepID=B8M671_TALSN|nr:E3 ubiquitin-protein ligase PIB1, putative [Talaromyces stipitatus ATCC 10500]EED19071.1 E3 ubiquitin-protein ligase PIB1, putative [Talaromyces stipitatus ATCC 10500]
MLWCKAAGGEIYLDLGPLKYTIDYHRILVENAAPRRFISLESREDNKGTIIISSQNRAKINSVGDEFLTIIIYFGISTNNLVHISLPAASDASLLNTSSRAYPDQYNIYLLATWGRQCIIALISAAGLHLPSLPFLSPLITSSILLTDSDSRFMSSRSSNNTPPSPLAPFPSYSAELAGSSSSSPVLSGDTRVIAPSSSSSPDNADTIYERSRAYSGSMDRKRRLTSTANDDATLHRRPSTLSGPSSLSYNRVQQQDRPLPMLPTGDGRNNYTSSDMPGSSRANAIDLTSPPPARDQTTAPLSRQHSRSLPTVHQRHQQNYMEYTLPRWQPDSEVTHCPICNTQFSFWYRKHHCRKCGRVYIVRPPEPAEYLTTGTSPRHRRDSSRTIFDLTTDDILDTTTVFPSRSRAEHYPANPALGGGEEVRLCNPCVPDPNPDPPVNYATVRAGFDSFPGQDWNATMPAFPISQRFHQVRRSLSGAQIFGSRGDTNREAQDNNNQRNQVLDDFLGRRTSSATPIEPSFGQRPSSSRYASSLSLSHPVQQSSARLQSHSFLSHRPRAETESRNTPSDLSGTRPRRVQSMAEPDRFRASRPPHRAQIDERDICPICSTQLPPRGSDGNENEREAHIRDCIARSSGSSPGAGSPQPQHLLRMLSFTATEKDCLSEDGTPQECSICMEEYEVGDKLARLECLCKFHKSCIVGWFERKKECPVHKFS